MFDNADALNDLMYKAHSMEKPSEHKGNFTMFSFDKSIRLMVKSQDVIEFSDVINLAQQKINEFLEQKSKDADNELMIIVNNAFKTKRGGLDKASVLGLFNHDIKNKLWIEAMNLIKESITTNHTRRYVVIAKRDQDGNYTDINLNFSSL